MRLSWRIASAKGYGWAIAWLALARAGTAVETARAPAEAVMFYVATEGRDDHPGTAAAPFATLIRAREALRALRAKGEWSAPVRVWVRGGTYYLSETIRLGPEDSGRPEAPVIYQAYPDEQVRLVGGRPITGFASYQGEIVQANVGAQGFHGINFRQLFFDGMRQELARYPNRDPDDPHGGAWAYVDGKRVSMYEDLPDAGAAIETPPGLDFWQRNRPERLRTLCLRPEDVRRWSRPEEGEVSIFPRFNWSHHLLPIESLEASERLLRLGEGAWWEIRPGDRYAVRGLREELDCPGEWYLDREAQRLYFWPPAPLEGKQVLAPTLPTVIEMVDCAHVTFQGFTVECCEDGAISLQNCTDCRIAACTIRHTGGEAVAVEGGRDNGIVGCDIYDVGSHGIRLAGGDLGSLTPAGNYADNNYIHHVGQVGRYSSALRFDGVGNRATHNLIHDVPGPGILVAGARHRLEFNRLRHTCLEAEDTGAISCAAIDWLSCQGVIIQHNFVHDTIGYGYDPQAGEWRSPYFTWALYPDWAASGMYILGNILARAPKGCLFLHSGRDNVVENNILIDGGESQILCHGWTTSTGFWRSMVDGWIEKYEAARQHPAWRAASTLKDPREVPLPDGRVMYGNVFRRNILCYRGRGAALWQFNNVSPERIESDYNLIWHFGEPVRTGVPLLGRESGPNLVPNAGLEEGPVGAWPTGWGWFGRGNSQAEAAVVEEGAYSGRRCLQVDTGPHKGAGRALAPVYVGVASTAFEPGKAYRFTAWMRAEAPGADVILSVYSWEKDLHNWLTMKTVRVGEQWQLYESLVRLPEKGDPAYRATMETLWCRLDFPADSGLFWVDELSFREAELGDEWEGWQAQGLDRHSLIADPHFIDPERDDYRLRPGSPAWGLGFQPIPVEQIGPYEDALRASWPIVEAPGARELLAKRQISSCGTSPSPSFAARGALSNTLWES